MLTTLALVWLVGFYVMRHKPTGDFRKDGKGYRHAMEGKPNWTDGWTGDLQQAKTFSRLGIAHAYVGDYLSQSSVEYIPVRLEIDMEDDA